MCSLLLCASTSASTSQCCSKFYKDANDGSLDYEEIDAKMYADFGVDYLKFGVCTSQIPVARLKHFLLWLVLRWV